jgi:hypothetical protein
MPLVRFEITIPESERVKTVHASDRAAIVISQDFHTYHVFLLTAPWSADCAH